MEEKRVSPETTKRIRKVGQVFKSPFLVKYSHLIDGTKEFKNALLEYVYSTELDEDELLYDDGHSFLTRKLVKTLGDNVDIDNDIIDAWSLILNARNAIDDKKRVFFLNEAFRDAFLMYLNKYEIKIGEKMPTYTVKLVEMPWRTLNNNVDCGIYTMHHMESTLESEDGIVALELIMMRYTYEVIVDDLNKYKADVGVKARKYYNAISKN
uniref:Ubiquitin-like protease family profile domain-containing protein n=1 Tax=Chenopodium quinoa TaxID=63459 RepID=A0A803MRJ6_CHEQI